MTEFQKRIVEYLKKCPNNMASIWSIAQGEFPEKWAKKSGRAALVGHIDRRGSAIPGMVRLPPRDEYGDPTLCWHVQPAGSLDPADSSQDGE